MPPGKNTFSLPGITRYLQVCVLLIVLLYFGETLFVPLFFGLLVAIIAYPACKWLEQRHWPRSLAVGVLITIIILLFLALVWLLGYEINLFIGDVPQIRERIFRFSSELRDWIETTFGMHQAMQENLLQRITINFEESINSFMSGVLTATASTFFILILIPVFASLFLYHRATFVKFLESVAGDGYKGKLDIILRQSIVTYFRFVKGTFFVYCIVGALNSIGLLALGIRHAVVFGMVTAFMTAIPYIGIIVSAALPVSVALITKDSVWYALGVILVFSFVQYLEANVIFPRVVGQQLNLSTWSVLVAIILGTLLWGISGMILFVPFAAMLKIFTDHIEELKPLNILLSRNHEKK